MVDVVTKALLREEEDGTDEYLHEENLGGRLIEMKENHCKTVKDIYIAHAQ